MFTIAPSPLDKSMIWAGSDDGLIHLTRDGGKTWAKITPPAVEPWTRINIIEASSHDPATAYVAANRYQVDDFRPYIYRTHDYGKTWTLAASGIPGDTFVRTVRQDPARPQLLFAGTETGVYVSFNDGDHWQPLQMNLPIVPITDLTLKDGDLVASTQGRAFWILDDITPLEQITPEVAGAAMHLFKPRAAYRSARGRSFGPRGANDGVAVVYYLASAPAQPVKLEFLDGAGKTIKAFTSEPRSSDTRGQRGRFGEAVGRGDAVPAAAGLNRFVWDMRHPDADGIEGGTYLFGGSLRGPEAAPGAYQVRISIGDQSQTQPLEIRKDPRVSTTPQDYQKQLTFLLAVRDKLSAANGAINRLRSAQQQVQAALKNTGAGASVSESARKLNAELEAELRQLYEARFTGFDDQTLIYPLKLNNRIAALQNYVQGEYPPTEQATEVFADLSAELDRVLAQVKQTLDVNLPALNSQLRAAATGQD